MKRLIGLFKKKVASSLLLLVGAAAGGLAQADTTYTYTYDYSLSVNGCSGWNNSCGLSGSQTGSTESPASAPVDPNKPALSISATATGWANTGGNSNAINAQAAVAPNNQTLQQGHLQAWSGGIGVRNKDYYITTDDQNSSGGYLNHDRSEWESPEHAVDNNERYDSILYAFDQSLSLTAVNLTWSSGDSDLSVLAYTGDTSAIGFNIDNSLLNLRYDQLTSSGWTFISHLTLGGHNKTLSTGVSSSYWLIGAANPLVGGTGLDSNLDHIKIASLSGKITTEYTQKDNPPSGVPEPGSLALLGLGWLLLLRARAKS